MNQTPHASRITHHVSRITHHARIHILYEYGGDLRPHGSAFIRLLRPLTHPAIGDTLQVTAGLDYAGQAVDGVIVDRFWRQDLTPELATRLIEDVRRAGARLIYTLDDDLLKLPLRDTGWSTEKQHWAVQILLSQADGVLVTTQPLRERIARLNPRIAIVRNTLDERLLVGGNHPAVASPFGRRRKVIGYMGTLTHDDDLRMILPALRQVLQRHSQEVVLQIVGVAARAETLAALDGLPVEIVCPRPEEITYPLFMLWFTSRLRWDVAIAPLRDTPFNQCKSDIKFLDYSAMGAAGVYSRVPAYESTVQHLESGWLAENEPDSWAEALEALVTQDELRACLAGNALRYLYGERVLARCAHRWPEALDALIQPKGDL